MGKIIYCLSTTFWEHSSSRTLKQIHHEKAAFISHTPLLFPTMYYMTSTNISNFLRLTKQGQGSVFWGGQLLAFYFFLTYKRFVFILFCFVLMVAASTQWAEHYRDPTLVLDDVVCSIMLHLHPFLKELQGWAQSEHPRTKHLHTFAHLSPLKLL